MPNLAVFDQGGACGAAGPASAARSALGGSPGVRRATHRQDTQIEAALAARRPRTEDANRELPVALANLMKYMEEQGIDVSAAPQPGED